MMNRNRKRTAEKISWSVRFCLLAVLAGAILASGGCGGQAVVPATFNTYNDANKLFSIQYPAEWSEKCGGVKDHAYAEYTSGDAKIDIDASLVGSLIFSIAETGVVPQVGPGTDTAAAAKKVHWLEKRGFEGKENVKEEKAAMVKTNTGEGTQSEFKGTDSFGTPFHGYRATVVIDYHRIQIVCVCPEAEWASLKPAFDKVIASVGPVP
jgi:hypothetical protein